MPPGEPFLDALADAVLDGAAVDWAAAESSADEAARPFVRHLRLVASVAHVHRLSTPDASPASSSDGAPESDRWGHLRLIERIGRGTFGEVYSAWDTRLDREVALKLISAERSDDPHCESAVIHEGRLLARIRHPNVVTIHGAERIGDRIGLWMEFVRGRTLEQVLNDGATFREADVVRIGVEVCRAVSAVHGAGLLHRDIKAHNVMRAEDGRIVLMDFGAGTELADGSSSELAGTPVYLAPEVLAGGAATVRSDVYSLGVLLHHLVTGSYPVTGRSIRDVREAHERGERIEIRRVRPRVRPALARVVERACDPRTDRRYESVDALARDLNALQRRPALRLLRYAAAAAAAVLAVVLLASALAPSPLDRLVIVVRPFENLGDPGSRLVRMIADGVIAQLGIVEVEGFRAMSRETSFRLPEESRDLAAIGVDLVLEGKAQVSGDRLLMRAALSSVADGTEVWSMEIDSVIESEGDIRTIVSDLTGEVLDQLGLEPGPPRQQYDVLDLPTLEILLEARALREGRGQRAFDAIELYEAVLEASPDYPPALAELASTYGDLVLHFPNAELPHMHPDEFTDDIVPLASQALDLDETLADAHAAKAMSDAFALRWDDAEEGLWRAIRLEPTRTRLYADLAVFVLIPSGQHDEAIRLLQDVIQERDPLSLDLRRALGRAQINASLYEHALENLLHVLEEDPAFPFIELFAAWARYFIPGERAAALDWFEQFSYGQDGIKDTSDDRLGAIGYIHAINGRREEAEAIAEDRVFAIELPQRQAEIYGLLGDTDKVLDALEKLADLSRFRAAFYLDQPEFGLSADSRADFRRRRLSPAD